MTQLDDLFGRGGPLQPVPERVRERVLKTASQDFGELWKHLIIKAASEAGEATEKLRARGEQEARSLRQIIEAQRARIEHAQQLSFGFEQPTADETAQLKSEREHMKRRLAAIREELDSEPAQLKALYEVTLQRLEPVGLIYLWPATKLGR